MIWTALAAIALASWIGLLFARVEVARLRPGTWR